MCICVNVCTRMFVCQRMHAYVHVSSISDSGRVKVVEHEKQNEISKTGENLRVGCTKSRCGNNVKRTIYWKKAAALGQGCSR